MKSRFTQEQWNYIRTRCVTAIFVILFAALIFYFSNVWSFITKVFSLASPFFIGFAIAFLMGPTQRFIEKPLRRFIFKTDKTKTAMRTLSTLLLNFIITKVLTKKYGNVQAEKTVVNR